MAPWLTPPVLEGERVLLEALTPAHAADLADAAEEDRRSYGWTLVPRRDAVDEWLAGQLARAEQGAVPFAQVRRSDGRAVGATAYWNPRRDAAGLWAVEIGFTWLAASAQRTGINTEAKLLLIDHAFTELGVRRVDFKTDARNERSRRAIAGLGATFEGVLRSFGPSWTPGEEGALRDSAMFSVVDGEWPAVRAGLVARLAGGSGRPGRSG